MEHFKSWPRQHRRRSVTWRRHFARECHVNIAAVPVAQNSWAGDNETLPEFPMEGHVKGLRGVGVFCQQDTCEQPATFSRSEIGLWLTVTPHHNGSWSHRYQIGDGHVYTDAWGSEGATM